MSLRGEPVEQVAKLPDGRQIRVWIGVPNDPYIPHRELRTVDVELWEHDRAIAVATTLLDPEDTSEARRLLREVVAGLEAGTLEPKASAVERLAEDAG
jgi:hypothetical protein